MTRADMVAALTDMQSRVGHSDAALLRALADALEQADVVDNRKFGYWVYWIIPEPRLP